MNLLSYFFIKERIINYYDNNQRRIRNRFIMINGKMNGKYESWYENGNKEESCYYKNDLKNGNYEKFHHNGIISIRCFYKDDCIDGKYEKFYLDGTKYWEFFNKNKVCIENPGEFGKWEIMQLTLEAKINKLIKL